MARYQYETSPRKLEPDFIPNRTSKKSQDLQRARELKEMLLKYAIPQKDENGGISIIDIALFQKEASELIVLLLSAFDILLKEDEDYTKRMKRQ